MTNIEEFVDIEAPISVVYSQWTQFEQTEGAKLKWRAQILEQVPEDKIIWRSEGQKGHVDGAVTFHKIAPNLTRVLVTLEYHPQGFFEHAGNLWRAQGRRVRLELKHFRRQVMSEVLQHPDEVKGKRDVIKGGKVASNGDKTASV